MMNESPKSVLVGNTFEGIETTLKSNLSHQEMSAGLALHNSLNDDVDTSGIHYPRSLIFELTGLVGELACNFLTDVPLDPPPAPAPAPTEEESTTEDDNDNDEDYSISKPKDVSEKVSRSLGKILLKLVELCHSLSLQLGAAIDRKMALNNKKYPAAICKGKSGKYTQYSALTGITKEEGQSTVHLMEDNNDDVEKEEETLSGFLDSLDSLTAEIGSFATERQWSRFHTPRSLVLALLGELGELAELFQWKGDHDTIDSLKKEELDKIGQEIADVTIYLIRLSDVYGVDLKTAAQSIQNE